MQNNFVEQKIAEVGKYGGLFYDEVKIKEGLLFDPSSWELIGFTDLEDDDNGTDNIATINIHGTKEPCNTCTAILL